jgi:hypothetical protein
MVPAGLADLQAEIGKVADELNGVGGLGPASPPVVVIPCC